MFCTQPIFFNNRQVIILSTLFLMFILIGSFAAKSQSITGRLVIGNKSNCPIDITLVTCNAMTESITVASHSQQAIPLYDGDEPRFVLGDFPGGSSPDVIRFSNLCSTGTDQTNPNPCYSQNVYGITYSAGSYWFSVW